MQPVSPQNEASYKFARFELDPIRRVLLREGKAIALKPKVFETLLVLVRNSGRVMDKDELMQAVWPDTVVEEVNLAHNISVLRKLSVRSRRRTASSSRCRVEGMASSPR